jgi:Ufm1-specific protease 2
MIKDVHLLAAVTPCKSSQPTDTYFVRGSYEYHHYGQGATNDVGWGCAYRSCQTLISFFMLRDPVAVAFVPSIQEMQQCLVDLGDKPLRFVGSHDWIGSVEVSLLVEHYTGAPCKILHVADVTAAYADILCHFEHVGTPIMVGGDGGGARAIVGIELDSASPPAIARFLAVDPHYAGPDDPAAVRAGAARACAWVSPGILARQYGAFTNFCLPLLPPPPAARAACPAATAALGPAREEEWQFEVVESG